MGGQACVFYGGAEFSRDLDLLILADSENLLCLRNALVELEAEPIAVPGLELRHLEHGLAVHFRCFADEVAGLRIDLMSSLREMPPFDVLWNRRTVIDSEGEKIDLMALEDLVQARKTQRDKDWPMIRRLVEHSWFTGEGTPRFWLRQLRTPELLLEAVQAHPQVAGHLAPERQAVSAAIRGDLAGVIAALDSEEKAERAADREYWEPLKHELELLRRNRLRKD